MRRLLIPLACVLAGAAVALGGKLMWDRMSLAGVCRDAITARDKGDHIGMLRALGYTNEDLWNDGSRSLVWTLIKGTPDDAEADGDLATAKRNLKKIESDRIDELLGNEPEAPDAKKAPKAAPFDPDEFAPRKPTGTPARLETLEKRYGLSPVKGGRHR